MRATLDYPRGKEQAHVFGAGLKGCSGDFTSKQSKGVRLVLKRHGRAPPAGDAVAALAQMLSLNAG